MLNSLPILGFDIAFRAGFSLSLSLLSGTRTMWTLLGRITYLSESEKERESQERKEKWNSVQGGLLFWSAMSDMLRRPFVVYVYRNSVPFCSVELSA